MTYLQRLSSDRDISQFVVELLLLMEDTFDLINLGGRLVLMAEIFKLVTEMENYSKIMSAR